MNRHFRVIFQSRESYFIDGVRNFDIFEEPGVPCPIEKFDLPEEDVIGSGLNEAMCHDWERKPRITFLSNFASTVNKYYSMRIHYC